MRVCEGLYNGVETRVVLNGGNLRWFVVERGLRQGGLGKDFPCHTPI